MNQITRLIVVFMSAVILFGCAAGRYPYPKYDLGDENWRSQVETNSNRWVMKADQWFLAGGDSPAKVMNNAAGYHETISRTTIVDVPNFQSIKAIGNFQVQITGHTGRNTVTIEGPLNAVRALSVKVNRNILCIEQLKDAPPIMRQVIIRISMNDLRSLVHVGDGSVEGVRLESPSLVVDASGCGNIFLVGHLNVRKVIARGQGAVNIFTVNSFDTEIETYNAGSVNIDARNKVMLRSINHKGNGDINVIGAGSNGLVINAQGRGKIGISGKVNVREVRASGKTCVFIAVSNSTSPCIYVYDDARVGIAGAATSFNGYTTGTSRLYARDLFAQNSYVEAYGQSHMNVLALNKIFAAAYDYATIYFYGDPNILTSFTHGNGAIINMGMPTSPFEVIVPKHKAHKGCHCGGSASRSSVSRGIKMGTREKFTPQQTFWRRDILLALSEDHKYV